MLHFTRVTYRRKNQQCLPLVLCLTMFANAFASAVNLHSEPSDAHQYLDNWLDSQEMDNKEFTSDKKYHTGTKTPIDPGPFHLSLFRTTDRTEVKLKSVQDDQPPIQKSMLRNKEENGLEKSACYDQHSIRRGDKHLQGSMTYFQGETRQQVALWIDRESSTSGYRTKRIVRSNDEHHERSVSDGKQKKAKVLGRLLMNGASNKNDVNEQDDYIEDDDYFRGRNVDKLNWKNYENEDGPSVMELIALSVRHKTNKWRSHEEGLLY